MCVLYLFIWNNNSLLTFVIKVYILVDLEVEDVIKINLLIAVDSIQPQSLKSVSAVVIFSASTTHIYVLYICHSEL